MSTKIYDGIVFEDTDCADLLQNLVADKKEIVERINEGISQSIYRALSKIHKKEIFTIGELLYVDQEFKELFGLTFEEMFNHLNLLFAIFPYQGKIYGIMFGGRADINKLSHTKYKNFFYFDNVDRPDEISDDEWEHRREVWNAILVGDDRDGVPKNNGFIFDVYDLKNDYSTIHLIEWCEKHGCLKKEKKKWTQKS